MLAQITDLMPAVVARSHYDLGAGSANLIGLGFAGLEPGVAPLLDRYQSAALGRRAGPDT